VIDIDAADPVSQVFDRRTLRKAGVRRQPRDAIDVFEKKRRAIVRDQER